MSVNYEQRINGLRGCMYTLKVDKGEVAKLAKSKSS